MNEGQERSMRKMIEKLHKAGASAHDIAHFLYRDHEIDAVGADRGVLLDIRTHVATQLDVPIDNIYVTGSAKLGLSLRHGGPFVPGNSDLDLAIVDEKLASASLEAASQATGSFRRAAAFPTLLSPGSRTAYQTKQRFGDYTKLGIVHPDYMPDCSMRRKIRGLFEELTARYAESFCQISVLIYSSFGAFADAQRKRIADYVATIGSGAVANDLPGWQHPSTDILRIPLSGQAPPSVPRPAWDALNEIAQWVRISCAIVIPLGPSDGAQDCFDVVLIYEPIDQEPVPLGPLWQIASRLGRRNVSIRYVPQALDIASLTHLVSSHLLTSGRELGERVLSQRLVIAPV